MNGAFIKLLVMGVTAAIPAAGVMILRLLLKKAPRWITCALWILVALRLVLPFSLQSRVSVVPAQSEVSERVTRVVRTIDPDVGANEEEEIEPAAVGIETPHDPRTAQRSEGTWFSVLPIVWAAGASLMLLYMIASYVRMRVKVREAVKVGEKVYICDGIDTPFILGALFPRIYVPSYIEEEDMRFVTEHERAHLSRLDHIWKPLGFFLLSVYWFNPVLWVAYIMLCRDIEFACDEKVISRLGSDAKASYSNALINCSAPRNIVRACPLAFGETGVKKRIKSILNYKKTSFWIIVVSVVLCIAVSVCLLTDRTSPDPEQPDSVVEETEQNTLGTPLELWDESVETPARVMVSIYGYEYEEYTIDKPEDVKRIADALKNVRIGDRNDFGASDADWDVRVITDKGRIYEYSFCADYVSDGATCFETIGVGRLRAAYPDTESDLGEMKEIRHIPLWEEGEVVEIFYYPDPFDEVSFRIDDREAIEMICSAARRVGIGDKGIISLPEDEKGTGRVVFGMDDGTFCAVNFMNGYYIDDPYEIEHENYVDYFDISDITYETLYGARFMKTVASCCEGMRDQKEDESGRCLYLWDESDEMPVKITMDHYGVEHDHYEFDKYEDVAAISEALKNVRIGDGTNCYALDSDWTLHVTTDKGQTYKYSFIMEFYTDSLYGSKCYETTGGARLSDTIYSIIYPDYPELFIYKDTPPGNRGLNIFEDENEPVKVVYYPNPTAEEAFQTEDSDVIKTIISEAKIVRIGDRRGDANPKNNKVTGRVDFVMKDGSTSSVTFVNGCYTGDPDKVEYNDLSGVYDTGSPYETLYGARFIKTVAACFKENQE